MEVLIVSLQDGFGNMLFNPLLQLLGSRIHVPIIAVARDLIHDVAAMRSR